MKVRELISLLESKGWRLKTTRGSHRQYLHPERGLVVTVPANGLLGYGMEIPAPSSFAGVVEVHSAA